jgi:Fic family protein
MTRPDIHQLVAEANTEYYHWEKLQYRPRPEGVTAEEAWQAVKWSRMGNTRALPLRDERGRHFTFWLPTPALQILHEIDRGGGATLALPEGAVPALGAMRDRVVISSLMEEAIATSQIEGAVTTRKVAKEMLRTNRKPRDRSEQMIVNSYRTIQLLRQRLDRPLSLELLFEIQECMTRATLNDPTGAGRLRTAEDNVSIVDVRDNEVVFVPPPAGQLPERLKRLIEFANDLSDGHSFIHPLVKAAILHFWLAYEHPFVDGNGRTARALLYWLMLKSGYWLFEFLTISRVIVAAPAQYYRSFLYSELDDNDLTYSLIYQLQATQRALANLRAYLREKQAEQQQLAVALRRFPDINYRQRALIDDALRHPARVFTFQSHQNSHEITYVTARSDLLDLLKRGLLTETRQGRQRGFVAAADLAKRLDAPLKRPKRREAR